MNTISARLATTSLVVLSLLALVPAITGAQETGQVVRTYSVQPTPASEAAHRIHQALQDSSPAIETRIDPKTGQLMVRGTAAQHEAIGRLVQLWAQMPAAVPPVHRDTMVRQAQAVELAPATPPADEAPNELKLADGGNKTATSHHRLEHLTWRQLASSLRTWIGPQLIMQGDNANEQYWFNVKSPDGEIRFDIDGRLGLLSLTGPEPLQKRWLEAIRLLDQPSDVPDGEVRFVSVGSDAGNKVGQAVMLLKAHQQRGVGLTEVPISGPRLANPLAQQVAAPVALAQVPGQAQPEGEVDEQNPQTPAPQQPPVVEEAAGALGPVRIELLPGMDAIIVRGSKKDVERVMQLINDIETLSVQTDPQIEIIDLKHTNSEAMATLVTTVNSQVLTNRLGVVSVTPLVKPNSLLLVGRAEAVKTTRSLIERLDTPVEAESEVRVFKLQHLPVADAQRTVVSFYDQRAVGLGPRIRVTADFRSNSLIVYARNRDLDELAHLLEKLDSPEGGPTSEVRVFRLKNALADDLAPVLEDTLRGDPDQRQAQAGGFGGGFGGGGAGGGGGAAPGQAVATTTGGNQQIQTQSSQRSSILSLTVIDAEGKRALKSGFLTDIRVSADPRANSLIVVAPPEAMDLISELIRQMDDSPSNIAEIKVFPIVRGDAQSLVTMLQTLFAQQAQANQLAQQAAGGAGESTLVPLRFSVDQRTNSIIATGNPADLNVVYAILLRLDADDVRERQSRIYRLQNAPATSVADAINQFLQTDRNLALQLTPESVSPFEQLEREVVVVPETVSNSLIISATPRYFEEVVKLVRELDERPPMVLIQVLIAEVALGTGEEFGAELGIQDSLLFDRSVVTPATTTAGGSLVPGYNFNNQPLGNSSSVDSLSTRDNVAGQALSSLGLGRTSNALGFGGLVLSASSDSVSVLIRALQSHRRADVLARPQVMTLNNQPAFVQVGAQVPYITSTQLTQFGTVNSITFQNVGILLGVRPRISPDGLVVMEIDATKSKVGPEEEGIPISISNNGTVLKAPQIEVTLAQTTVSARDGQTVVLGGLITKERDRFERKVPYVADIPLLGSLFRYDQYLEDRRELLIIMTPYIVDSDAEVEQLTAMESERMNWCYADVVNLHHDYLAGPNPRAPLDGSRTEVIYPDLNPSGATGSSVVVPGKSSSDADSGVEIHGGEGEIPAPRGTAPGKTPAVPSAPVPRPATPVPPTPSLSPATSGTQTDTSSKTEQLEVVGPAVIQQASKLPTTVEKRSTDVQATNWEVGTAHQTPQGTITEYRSVDNPAAVDQTKKKRSWLPKSWSGKKSKENKDKDKSAEADTEKSDK